MFPGLVIVERLRPFRRVDFDNALQPEPRAGELGSDPGKAGGNFYLNSLNQDLTGKNAYLLIREG